jgi:hypothetical protein
MNDIGVIEVIVGLLLFVDCFVSIQLVAARDLTMTQKGLQLVIVWLIPLFGALGIYFMRRSDREPRGPQEPPFGGGANDGMPGGIQGP